MQHSNLEQLLRYDRKIVAMSLFLVSLACWSWILSDAGMGMSAWEMTRPDPGGLDKAPMAIWTPATVGLIFFTWLIMMVAMLVPSATPLILLAAALNRDEATGKQAFASSAVLVAGYLLAWAVFSAFAVTLQWALQKNGLVWGLLNSESNILSALLLIAAGAWQFTPFKYTGLRNNRSPIDFLDGEKRHKPVSTLGIGVHHGMYCLARCWFLITVLFIGGLMNLLWIAGLAVYVWVEKLLPPGEIVGKVMGGLLIAWGIGILLSPFLAG